MTARRARLLNVLLPAIVGAAAMLALLANASADTGTPLDAPASLSSWQVAAQHYTPAFLLGLYGVLWCLTKLGDQRSWRWTGWLRVGRRKAHLSALLVTLGAFVPSALDGTIQPGAVLMCLSTWGLARSMPGGMEPKPDKGEASGEIDDGQVPS